MSEFIPFVNSQRDCAILKTLYPDASIFRVSLCASDGVRKKLPEGPRRWVDSAVDIFHGKWPEDPREEHRLFETYDPRGVFRDLASAVPGKKDAEALVNLLLNACLALQPFWLSVPQLPYDKEKRRATVNRQMAQAAGGWASQRSFAGTLILPVILTHKDQVNRKPQRDRIISLATKNCAESGARGVWVVDASLNDQSGAGTNQDRFSNLVDFHRDLQAQLPDGTIIVAGPYWGMNIVVWARGLVTHAAIGLGSSFQYRYSGSASMGGTPSVRVALAALRRQAIADVNLEKWLDAVIETVAKGSEARRDFETIRRQVRTFGTRPEEAREQVAKFYRAWLDVVSSVPVAGRSLALYQDLSNAYILGKGIKEPLVHETTARRPERIAQQLMLSCL